MKSIFLYRDEGVCPSSLRATVRSLREKTNRPIDLVNREAFLKNGWEEKAEMIIFPGGRDIPYLQALQGAANHRIRDYVINGGRYFGICAGAYYGSASICFEAGGVLEVIGKRELSFFPGCAEGPALGLGQFAYENSQGARIAPLLLDDCYFSRPTIQAYYNGGCTFVQAALYPNVTVLAHYEELQEKSPAIILCQVGLGKALLSGVHPEYHTSDHNKISDIGIPLNELACKNSHKNSFFYRLIDILQE
jgi:glutamine amidotransferase-like uncharacterized protein